MHWKNMLISICINKNIPLNMYGSYTKFTYHNYGTLQLQYLSQDTSIN